MFPESSVGLDDVAGIAARLAATDLRPGRLVDDLFGRLVASVMVPAADHPSVSCPQLSSAVRDLCARGESYLERHWAQRVVDDPTSLAEFPYLRNYRRLVEGEYRAIRDCLGREPEHLVFAGSGPLPLTAVLLARLAPGLTITCLDQDAEALGRGAGVVRALSGGRARIRFVHAEADGYDYSGCDVVVLAALVGDTRRGKTVVLDRVARSLRDDAVIAARSVPPDARRLLYVRIDPGTVPPALRVLGEWSPPTGVINSLLLRTVHGCR